MTSRLDKLRHFSRVTSRFSGELKDKLLRFNEEKQAVIYGTLVYQVSKTIDGMAKLLWAWERGGRHYLNCLRITCGSYFEMIHFLNLLLPMDQVTEDVAHFAGFVKELLYDEALYQMKRRQEVFSVSKITFNELETVDLMAAEKEEDDELYERILYLARLITVRSAWVLEHMDEREKPVYLPGLYQVMTNCSGIGAHLSEGKGRYGYRDYKTFLDQAVGCAKLTQFMIERRNNFLLPPQFFEGMELQARFLDGIIQDLEDKRRWVDERMK